MSISWLTTGADVKIYRGGVIVKSTRFYEYSVVNSTTILHPQDIFQILPRRGVRTLRELLGRAFGHHLPTM